MVLPLSILESTKNRRVTIETKDGKTYRGQLLAYDHYMNVYIRPVTCASQGRESYWRADECYMRGSHIKIMTLPDEALEDAFDKEARIEQWRRGNNLSRPYYLDRGMRFREHRDNQHNRLHITKEDTKASGGDILHEPSKKGCDKPHSDEEEEQW